MTDFHQMLTFVLVSELGSLAAASRKQGISAAAISKQLTRLEEEVGVQLLVRTTRKIELTEVGVNYWQQCRRILEEVEVAASLISQTKAIPSGILKVVSGRHYAATYIVPHMNEFLIKFPNIELKLELAERIPDLNLESIDVLIGMSISAPGDAIQKCIATTSYVLCASPKYLKKFGTPKKLTDLQNHRYITHSMRLPDNVLTFKNKESVTVKPYIRVNDSQAMLDFALDGMGIVRLHRYVVQNYLGSHELQEILPSYNTDTVSIYVAYSQRRFVPSKIRCFIDFISEKMSSVKD
ncbi:MAG: LysR family transcriptional regulator [Parachlamydiaceae bacterium]|nr:LysR family transcriptional regulator [Parachlamydiaceae bacterium]